MADQTAFDLSAQWLRTAGKDKDNSVSLPRQYCSTKSYHESPIAPMTCDNTSDFVAVVDVTGTYTSDLKLALSRREVKGDDFHEAMHRLRLKMKCIPPAGLI